MKRLVKRGRATKAAQQGLTLVELMIALLLGLVLSAAVIQVFLATKNVYRMQGDMARIQENGRFATEALSRDIRMAGFSGCGNIDRLAINVIADPPTGSPFDSNDVIRGLNDVEPGNSFAAKAGTDVITLRGAAGAGIQIHEEGADNANIKLRSNPYGFKAGDTLVITDCVNADVFNATTVSNDGSGNKDKFNIAHASNMNTDNKLSKIYGPDAEILVYQTLSYYVKKSGRETPGGRSIDSLWVQLGGDGSGTGSGTAVEVIEGIEDLQVEYGLATGTARVADVYLTADAIANNKWSKVVSVRFSLLIAGHGDNTVASAGDYAQTYKYNGETVTLTDGALRDVFGNVVAIRNRVP